MNWVEILQVAGPIALGLAGILSGYGIARHQSKSALQAEARARAFVSYSSLLETAQEVFTLMSIHINHDEENRRAPSEILDLEKLMSRTNASATACHLVNGGALEFEVRRLVAAMSDAQLTLRYDDYDVETAHKNRDKLGQSISNFVQEARVEVGGKETIRTSKPAHRK